MSEKKDGGPAFPNTKIGGCPSCGSSGYGVSLGLSLRDYFAAKALTGQLHNDAFSAHDYVSPDIMAKRAYAYADAMIAAREKP